MVGVVTKTDVVHQISRFDREGIFPSLRRTSPLVFTRTHDNRTPYAGAGSGCGRSFRDEPQNLLEHLPRHRYLGHLECDVAAVVDDLGADFDIESSPIHPSQWNQKSSELARFLEASTF